VADHTAPPGRDNDFEDSAMAQTQLQDSEPSDSLNQMPPQSKRVPLVSKVILKFHHYGGFFIEYSANISQTGMFIKTTQPKPAGSVFIFEIWLGEKYKLVHGLGEVVWAREEADGPDRPPGMGVRYLKLDKDSREVIQRVVMSGISSRRHRSNPPKARRVSSAEARRTEESGCEPW
jgi:uncharacterized protein (TIGR02266 family)